MMRRLVPGAPRRGLGASRYKDHAGGGPHRSPLRQPERRGRRPGRGAEGSARGNAPPRLDRRAAPRRRANLRVAASRDGLGLVRGRKFAASRGDDPPATPMARALLPDERLSKPLPGAANVRCADGGRMRPRHLTTTRSSAFGMVACPACDEPPADRPSACRAKSAERRLRRQELSAPGQVGGEILYVRLRRRMDRGRMFDARPAARLRFWDVHRRIEVVGIRA